VKATTWRLLVAIALVSGVVSWGLLRAWTNSRGALPQVPWLTAVVIGVFGAIVLVSALLVRPRIRRKEGHRPLDPLVAARFAVLSLASSRAGALFVGLYGGFLATAVSDLTIDYRRHVAVVSGLCVLASALLVAGGLVLERVCRLPPDEPGSPSHAE
jgi:TctA family transporter